jgi:hypothetical protein
MLLPTHKQIIDGGWAGRNGSDVAHQTCKGKSRTHHPARVYIRLAMADGGGKRSRLDSAARRRDSTPAVYLPNRKVKYIFPTMDEVQGLGLSFGVCGGFELIQSYDVDCSSRGYRNGGSGNSEEVSELGGLSVGHMHHLTLDVRTVNLLTPPVTKAYL